MRSVGVVALSLALVGCLNQESLGKDVADAGDVASSTEAGESSGETGETDGTGDTSTDETTDDTETDGGMAGVCDPDMEDSHCVASS